MSIYRKRVIKFTPKQEKIIKELYLSGKGAPEIAEITKFSGKTKIGDFIKQEGMSRTTSEIAAMKADKKLKGIKFGLLMLIDRFIKNGIAYWNCKCDCGNNQVIIGQHQIVSGETKSCGCICRRKKSLCRNWKGYGEISGYLFCRYKAGAESRALDFEVNIEYLWNLFLEQEERCAISGISLIFPSSGTTSDGTASLDRIDSSKGYIEGNCRWVHKWLNIMKRDLGDKEFYTIIKQIYENKNLKNFNSLNFEKSLNSINFGNKNNVY